DGICPAIAIRQRTPSRNPRSTVATATEIHDYLRLLYARVGRTVCDSCGAEVVKDTPESVVERLLGLPQGTPLLIGFPGAGGGAPLPDLFDRLRKKGFGRLLVGEQGVRLEEFVPEPETALAEVVVLVDRVVVRSDVGSRLADSVETAFAEGSGLIQVHAV